MAQTKQKVKKKSKAKVKEPSLKTSQRAKTQKKEATPSKALKKAKAPQKAHQKVKVSAPKVTSPDRVQAKSIKSKPTLAKKQASPSVKVAKKPVTKAKPSHQKPKKPIQKAKTSKTSSVQTSEPSKVKKTALKANVKSDTKPTVKTKTNVQKSKAQKKTQPISSRTKAKSKPVVKQTATPKAKEDLQKPHSPLTEGKVSSDVHKSKDSEQYDAIEVAFNEEQVVLTNAEGQRFCYDKDCDQPATVDIYCRKHYILSWHLIEQKKQILEGNKLEKFIEQITTRYPDKFLEMIRKNLSTERDFTATLQELGLSSTSEGKKESSPMDDSSLHFTEDMPLSR